MCEKNLIAKRIVDSYISMGRDFSYEDLIRQILEMKGILRISAGVTIHDYLSALDDAGVIKYNPYDNSYIVFNGKLEEILDNN